MAGRRKTQRQRQVRGKTSQAQSQTIIVHIGGRGGGRRRNKQGEKPIPTVFPPLPPITAQPPPDFSSLLGLIKEGIASRPSIPTLAPQPMSMPISAPAESSSLLPAIGSALGQGAMMAGNALGQGAVIAGKGFSNLLSSAIASIGEGIAEREDPRIVMNNPNNASSLAASLPSQLPAQQKPILPPAGTLGAEPDAMAQLLEQDRQRRLEMVRAVMAERKRAQEQRESDMKQEAPPIQTSILAPVSSLSSSSASSSTTLPPQVIEPSVSTSISTPGRMELPTFVPGPIMPPSSSTSTTSNVPKPRRGKKSPPPGNVLSMNL